eukprot:TRINITY_DN2034_c0_g1_i1.p1 TRINITY_DN2034_c0_g1~~TRINITY_DN2034_c0_g1_i1.p1  ORF type:complete len:316 (-),score=49.46 TRINITY_DN2034_c0_g1_i1:196-1143(-)
MCIRDSINAEYGEQHNTNMCYDLPAHLRNPSYNVTPRHRSRASTPATPLTPLSTKRAFVQTHNEGKSLGIPGYTGHVHAREKWEFNDEIDTMRNSFSSTMSTSSMNSTNSPSPGKWNEDSFSTYGRRTVHTVPSVLSPSNQIHPRRYFQSTGRSVTPRKLRNIRSNAKIGDDRLALFETVSHTSFTDPADVGVREFIPTGPFPSREETRRNYAYACRAVSSKDVDAIEMQMRQKIMQKYRTDGFQMRRAFFFFDTDRSGGVSCEEMRNGLREYGMQYSEDQVLALMARYDPDCTDNIDYNTFVDKVLADTWAGNW